MIDLRRTSRLLWFDLATSVWRLKGLFFLLPFFLFWYVMLRLTGAHLAAWMQKPDGLLLASSFFDKPELDALFVQHPPSLSIFFVAALATLPLFAVLAGLDQFSSDLGRGFYRLLATRCRRLELFAAGYLGALILLGGALTVAALAATGVSLLHDGQAAAATLRYAGSLWLILMGYSAALTGFMSLVSVLCRSTLGSLFLGLFGYLFLLLLAATLDASAGTAVFHYVLPGALKSRLLLVTPERLPLLLGCLLPYVLVYAGLAWKLFNRVNF